MKRELITAALIVACVLAPYQAFEAETPAMGHLDTRMIGPVTPLFQQQGQVGVHLSGTLREFSVTAAGQPWDRGTVLGLELANGTLLQLSFYCRLNGTLVSTSDRIPSFVSDPFKYCEVSQLPPSFHDGTQLSVNGTLLTPSQWQPNLSMPTIVFAGDFYVMEMLSQVTSFAVPARYDYYVHFDLNSGDTVAFSFSVSSWRGADDIGFTLVSSTGADLLNVGRVSQYSGNYTAVSPGTYYLRFDNSYSILTTKTVSLTYSFIAK